MNVVRLHDVIHSDTKLVLIFEVGLIALLVRQSQKAEEMEFLQWLTLMAVLRARLEEIYGYAW